MCCRSKAGWQLQERRLAAECERLERSNSQSSSRLAQLEQECAQARQQAEALLQEREVVRQQLLEASAEREDLAGHNASLAQALGGLMEDKAGKAEAAAGRGVGSSTPTSGRLQSGGAGGRAGGSNRMPPAQVGGWKGTPGRVARWVISAEGQRRLACASLLPLLLLLLQPPSHTQYPWHAAASWPASGHDDPLGACLITADARAGRPAAAADT